MSSEDTKILEFDQYQKFDKTPFIINSDLECKIAQIDGCKNNPENSSTTETYFIRFFSAYNIVI